MSDVDVDGLLTDVEDHALRVGDNDPATNITQIQVLWIGCVYVKGEAIQCEPYVLHKRGDDGIDKTSTLED